MRSSRLSAAALATLGIVACTSTLAGRGQVLSPPAGSGRTSPTSPSTSFSPPPGLLRTPVQTAIGDPVTANLCAAIGLRPFRDLASGLTPSFDHVQYPPGCSITESSSAGPIMGVGVFAHRGVPPTVTGGTTRVVDGRTIYVYPFKTSTGGCPRDIAAPGVLLTVDAYPLGTAAPDEALSCSGADAMADRLAAVLAAGRVPRVPLASPSISSLDACAVVRRALVTELGTFSGADIFPQGFGVNCEVRPAVAFLFFNFAISDTAPSNATATTVDGHRLYEKASRADFCSYVSTQGTTSDGRYEQVVASATVRANETAPEQLCEQTASALAQYLTAAGLH